MFDAEQAQFAAMTSVPLFPLPNVVLFPRAILPLHVFEERYKDMTADALIGPGRVAMALLRPGWEKSYHERPAIEPVVCVGKILSHERLPDGKYNFLLQGQTRARVVHEQSGKSYREAVVAPLFEPRVLEIDMEGERCRLARMFAEGPVASIPAADFFRRLIAGYTPTNDIVDLAAFNLLEDLALKQSLLADADPRSRAARVLAALGNAVDPSTN